MSRKSKIRVRKEARVNAYKDTIEKMGFPKGLPLPKRFGKFTKPGSGKHY